MNTGLVKDLRDTETFAPAQVESKNIRRSKVGSTTKRPGYDEWVDTGDEYSIIQLIDENNGYAIDSNGSIYVPTGKIHTAPSLDVVPKWSKYNDDIIVVNGRNPLSIDDTSVVKLAGNPPNAKFIAVISSLTVMAGYHPTEFKWSGVNNPESWPLLNFENIQKTGTIKSMMEQKDRLLFFKEKETEVWNYVGGDDPFLRYPASDISQGIKAVDSVVKANDDRIYWLGHEGDFYIYEGGSPFVLSDKMRRGIDQINNPHLFRGYDIRKESSILWNNHVDGISWLYDYSTDQWFEDNRWDNGWQSLPFDSYMELGGKQYFGSHAMDGKIYHWSEDYKDDDGLPIRVFRKFKVRLSKTGRMARVDEMLLRREGAMANSNSTAPVFSIRYRWDKGPWSKWKVRSLGATGKHNPYAVRMKNLGMGIDFEVEIQHSDLTDFVLTNALVTFTESSI
jgi:hypothetical protein